MAASRQDFLEGMAREARVLAGHGRLGSHSTMETVVEGRSGDTIPSGTRHEHKQADILLRLIKLVAGVIQTQDALESKIASLELDLARANIANWRVSILVTALLLMLFIGVSLAVILSVVARFGVLASC